MVFTCGICMEDVNEAPGKICCGQKFCSTCMIITNGYCGIHQRAWLNSPKNCDVCGEEKTIVTVLECSNCDKLVCFECDRCIMIRCRV